MTPEQEKTLLDSFDVFLLSKKKRRTPERRAVLSLITRMTGSFSVADIYDLLKGENFTLSFATIYSTLALIEEFGIVRRQDYSRRTSIYERTDKSPKSFRAQNQCHLICTECGKTRIVTDTELSRYVANLKFPRFNTSYTSINIYGICPSCNKKKKKKSKN
ncbi:MAG: transcriptional repressor [Muribaculaceae bacterium]|nr:transcriptional repressor [Muribaculaceae bacterium]MBR4722311.1 transcriptional repressor [Muribaculaceae bacterium]MBR5437076.1 transcriptional repressor [Muribaculaceae bacterium]